MRLLFFQKKMSDTQMIAVSRLSVQAYKFVNMNTSALTSAELRHLIDSMTEDERSYVVKMLP